MPLPRRAGSAGFPQNPAHSRARLFSLSEFPIRAQFHWALRIEPGAHFGLLASEGQTFSAGTALFLSFMSFQEGRLIAEPRICVKTSRFVQFPLSAAAEFGGSMRASAGIRKGVPTGTGRLGSICLLSWEISHQRLGLAKVRREISQNVSPFLETT